MDILTKPFFDIFSKDPILSIVFSSLFHTIHSVQGSLYGLNTSQFVRSLLGYIVFLTFFLVLLYAIRLFFLVRLHRDALFTFLEVKPPRVSLQSAYTTQQLFTLIHDLAKQRSLFHALLGYQKSYSLELVSTRNEGIRYVLRVPKDDADGIKKGLLSYLPGISVIESSDSIPRSFVQTDVSIAEYKLSSHFGFPLQRQNELQEHDPIAYMSGSMTKLAEDELIVFQLVAAPARKEWIKDIERICGIMYRNDDLVEGMGRGKGHTLFTIAKYCFLFFLHILVLPLGIVVFLFSAKNEGPFLFIPLKQTKKKTPNPYQAELEILVKGKLDQRLFTTSLRLLVVGKKSKAHQRILGFTSSLSSFANAYQSVRRSTPSVFGFFKTLKIFLFRQRLLGFYGNSILSVSEVSDLYHFPFTSTTRTEDMQTVQSKELPAPVSMKRAKDFDVIVAKNTFAGTVTDIGLTMEERRRHMYIVGATGTGKSTLLLSMITQDIGHNKGVCVIDPHGELIENILPLIPQDRVKDVIYFNPDDISFPMGLNIMQLPEDATGDILLREKEVVTESIISLFHKVWGEQYMGPRMEYILRNTIHTAFCIEHPTLFTIYHLLINEDYRNDVVKKLEDENLKDFWELEFGKAGDFQIASMISPITNKIGRFLFSPIAKRILEQEKSTINFDDIVDSKRILLCNLSKGKIGEDNSTVFGAFIMTMIQLATLKRARKSSNDRTDFYLYVDEFQNFATPSFAQILSEARKYKLNAILAHQTTSQIEERSLVNVTLANTGTVICFKTANPEDEKVILPQFLPSIGLGEIANLPSFHFYCKISALHPEAPFSGETIPVIVAQDFIKVEHIIESSRRSYTLDFHAQPPKKQIRTMKPKRAIESIRIDALSDIL